jgi:hypothetical protein
MHRIDGPGNVANLFVEPDASLGQQGTVVTAKFNNAIQEEICTAIEASGQTLNEADNGQLWAAMQGRGFFRNHAMNGLMKVCQRIPLFTTKTFLGVSGEDGFVIDRWFIDPGALGTAVIRWADLDLLTHNGVDQPGLPLVQGKLPTYMIYEQTTTSSVARLPRLVQRMPDVRNLAGETVTLSFYGRLAMPPDPGLDQFKLEIVQNFGTTGVPSSPVTYQSPTFEIAQSFGTWARYSFTTTLDQMQGYQFGTDDNSYLQFGLVLGDGGETFVLHITGIQLEVGDAAGSLEAVPYEVELNRCQRFYQQSYNSGVEPGTVTEQGVRRALEKSTIPYALETRLRVEMARVPDVVWYSPSAGTADRVDWNGTVYTHAGNVAESPNSTGYPGATAHGSNPDQVFAHWTAEAEL